MFLVIGAVALAMVVALGVRDLPWGLPRIRSAPRMRCLDCGASFLARDPNAAFGALANHAQAAHQGEDAPQLWPWPLPPRCTDIVRRQRVVPLVGRPRLVGGYQLKEPK